MLQVIFKVSDFQMSDQILETHRLVMYVFILDENMVTLRLKQVMDMRVISLRIILQEELL